MDALLDDGLSLLRLARGKHALRGNEGGKKRCLEVVASFVLPGYLGNA
jgi:hypothetical protein